MTATPLRRKLSELEGVILGIINNSGPCTAYSIRSGLRAAPSSHWRASAGSVYPLIVRLETEGLISGTLDTGDRRGTKLLRITTKGRAALRRWIKAGTDQEIISATADPARSRMFFLQALSPLDRVKHSEKMVMAMERYLAETRDDLANKSEQEDLFGYLGSLGAVRSTETRLEWLKVARQRIAEID